MNNWNSVMHRGRLGHDPELRKTSQGKSVTNVNIAVYSGKENTEWFTWVLWDKKADDFCFTAHKGDTVRMFGRAATSKGKTKGGEQYTQTMFVAEDFEIIPKPVKEETQYAYGQTYGQPAPPIDEEVPF